MENLNDISVSEGLHNVIILLDSKRRVLDNNELKWREVNYEGYGEREITLKEIYQQLKEKGYQGVIYVWEESPTNGIIYMCGNYRDGEWIKHGTTRGYV